MIRTCTQTRGNPKIYDKEQYFFLNKKFTLITNGGSKAPYHFFDALPKCVQLLFLFDLLYIHTPFRPKTKINVRPIVIVTTFSKDGMR